MWTEKGIQSSDVVKGIPPYEYVGGVGGDADDPAMGSLQVRDGMASRVHMAPEVDVLRARNRAAFSLIKIPRENEF